MTMERHADDRGAAGRLIGIALLPSAATLGNLLCGFFAILCGTLAIRDATTGGGSVLVLSRDWVLSPIAMGGYLLVFAMIFDALDGRLARLTRRTSEFGSQLDSIADIVSFGVAPAFLVLAVLLRPVGETPVCGALLWRCGVVSAVLFVSCAAIRLARFNAENTRDESGQKRFSGLPTPGGAAGIVALILLNENLLFNSELRAEIAAARWPWVTLVGATAGLGLLMVSRVDYVHVFNVYVRRKQPISHLVGLLICVAIAVWWFTFLLVLLAYAYVLSGILISVLRRWRRYRPIARVASNRAQRPVAHSSESRP